MVVGEWLLTLIAIMFTSLLIIPGIISLALPGGMTGLYSWMIISNAIKDKSKIFARTFPHIETRSSSHPSIKRLRKDGTGNVILHADGWWGNTFNEGSSISWYCNEVGFLSIGDAE